MVYVYFIREIVNKKKGKYGFIKIGIARNVANRLEALQTSNARELELLIAIPFKSRMQARHVEKKLHRRFRRFRVRGEWFDKRLKFEEFVRASVQIEDSTEPGESKEHDENVLYMQHFKEI